MKTLSEIRARIDRADEQIRSAYLDRLEATEEVAALKRGEERPVVYRPDRERQILDRAAEGLTGRRASDMRALFADVMRRSRSGQYLSIAAAGKALPLPETCEPSSPRRVLVQGAEGAYQHLAARRVFGETPVLFCETFSDVFERLGEEDAGVLPLENSTAGVVEEVFDALYRFDAFLCGSVEVNLRHALAGTGSLSEVRTVLAHPQALRQCDDFLREHGMRPQSCDNNAFAARTVARNGDPSVAAICAPECAGIYGLRILADGISDLAQNTTRFVILKKRFERVLRNNRIAVILRAENRAGALFEILSVFAGFSVNVLALHSRPWKESPFEYLFYLEFEGSYESDEIRALLWQLTEELPFVKILGTF